MKKSALISITAALLLCAVLCTAGCVEAPSDPIVGTYVTETDSAVSWAVFENEGTGCFAGDTGDAVFTWAAADSKNTYTLLFADGATETAVLDAEHGLMTIGEVVYQKYPSGYSGETPAMPAAMPLVEAEDRLTFTSNSFEDDLK